MRVILRVGLIHKLCHKSINLQLASINSISDIYYNIMKGLSFTSFIIKTKTPLNKISLKPIHSQSSEERRRLKS